MSAKAIFEAKGKSLLNVALGGVISENKFVSVTGDTDWGKIKSDNSWLSNTVSASQVLSCVHFRNQRLWFTCIVFSKTKTLVIWDLE